MRSLFRSALENNFISLNDSTLNKGGLCGITALCKMKIGRLQPKINLIFLPGLRLFSFEV